MQLTYLKNRIFFCLREYRTQHKVMLNEKIQYFLKVEECKGNLLTPASLSSSIIGLKKLFVGSSLAMSGIIPTRMTFSPLNHKCLGKVSIA